MHFKKYPIPTVKPKNKTRHCLPGLGFTCSQHNAPIFNFNILLSCSYDSIQRQVSIAYPLPMEWQVSTLDKNRHYFSLINETFSSSWSQQKKSFIIFWVMKEDSDAEEMNSLFIYDADRNRPDGKPDFSIPQLITQAILSNTERKMTLHDIYVYISKNYPYYKYVARIYASVTCATVRSFATIC